jgi:heat shock protein HslJ
VKVAKLKRTQITAVIFVLSGLLLSSCSGRGQSVIEGHWKLVANQSIDGVPALINERTTLYLENSEGNGGSGCNEYAFRYEISGNAITVVEAISATKKVCKEDLIMSRESEYLRALNAVQSFSRSGDSLTLEGPSQTLVFVREHAP